MNIRRLRTGAGLAFAVVCGSASASSPLPALSPVLAPTALPGAALPSEIQPPATAERENLLGVFFAPDFRATDPAMRQADASPAIPHHPALFDRFFIGLGAFSAESSTEARLDSSIGVGTNVDFEDLLGLDENDVVPQALARWRFSERWRVELEFFQLNRSNSVATTTDIDWGDQTFPAGSQLHAKFNIAVTRVSCGYSFFQREDKEIGLALGFHVTDIEAKLETTASNEDTGELLAPLPVISLYGQFALTDVWAVSSRIDAFKITYDPYQGHIISAGIDALCQPWRHFGFGLGWRMLQIQGSADSGDWKGEITSTYNGPILFVSTSF